MFEGGAHQYRCQMRHIQNNVIRGNRPTTVCNVHSCAVVVQPSED